MAITQNTNYVAEGLARLPDQYKGKPRIRALLTAWLTQAQELEDAMWTLYIDRMLQNNLAFGNLLDKIGKIVGQPRDGFADNVYILLVQARIQTNRATGQIEDILKIIELLIPSTAIYTRDWAYDLYNGITIEPQGPITWDPYWVSDNFLFLTKSAGVRYYLQWTLVPVAQTFMFSNHPGDPPNPYPSPYLLPPYAPRTTGQGWSAAREAANSPAGTPLLPAQPGGLSGGAYASQEP